MKRDFPINEINLKYYSLAVYFFHIRNSFSYKPRNDLCMYKSAELDLRFIDIVDTKNKNLLQNVCMVIFVWT